MEIFNYELRPTFLSFLKDWRNVEASDDQLIGSSQLWSYDGQIASVLRHILIGCGADIAVKIQEYSKQFGFSISELGLRGGVIYHQESKGKSRHPYGPRDMGPLGRQS